MFSLLNSWHVTKLSRRLDGFSSRGRAVSREEARPGCGHLPRAGSCPPALLRSSCLCSLGSGGAQWPRQVGLTSPLGHIQIILLSRRKGLSLSLFFCSKEIHPCHHPASAQPPFLSPSISKSLVRQALLWKLSLTMESVMHGLDLGTTV